MLCCPIHTADFDQPEIGGQMNAKKQAQQIAAKASMEPAAAYLNNARAMAAPKLAKSGLALYPVQHGGKLVYVSVPE